MERAEHVGEPRQAESQVNALEQELSGQTELCWGMVYYNYTDMVRESDKHVTDCSDPYSTLLA